MSLQIDYMPIAGSIPDTLAQLSSVLTSLELYETYISYAVPSW
jgi:hypothetical protein